MSNLTVSVIVPCYNDSQLLKSGLQHILKSGHKADEVIVVDDASTDASVLVAKTFGVKIIELEENQGVAFARNKGAEVASSDILLFIDSDVLISSDLIEKITAGFSDPKVQVFQGVVSYEPANLSYGAQCSALEWHYQERFVFSKGNISYHFNSQCCAIRKKFFLELGGFNTSYRGAGGEEFEINNRILEKSMMHIDPSITYAHHFQSLFKRCVTLLKRAQNFYEIMKNHKSKTPLKGYLFYATYGLTLISILLFFFNLKYFLLSIMLLFLINFRYFKFVAHEKGPVTSLYVFPGFYCYNVALSTGALWGAIKYHLGVKRLS